jgi:hypothetical protein
VNRRIAITLDNVSLGEWHDRPTRYEEDAKDLGVHFLSQCYTAYIDNAPFIRFTEGPYELLSRMAREIEKQVPRLDAKTLVEDYLREFGMPSLERAGMRMLK